MTTNHTLENTMAGSIYRIVYGVMRVAKCDRETAILEVAKSFGEAKVRLALEMIEREAGL